MSKDYDVIIVGAGPAGIFTALELFKLDSTLKVLMLDSGKGIRERNCPARKLGHCVHCNPCAIMSGWAGAGAFSDGKLSLSYEVGGNITRYIGEERAQQLIDYADGVYVSFGAPDTVHGKNDPRVAEIAYEASRHNIHLVRCPVRHMGTEYSAVVLGNMYDALCSYAGFEFIGSATADNILVENGHAAGISYVHAGKKEQAYASYVVAAPVRSAYLT